MQDTSTPVENSQDYRLIPLRGKCGKGKFVKVSPHRYEHLSRFKWYLIGITGREYARLSRRNADGKRQYIAMHRIIMNAPDGIDVDHINGDRLDNTDSNLRLATRSQNVVNRPRLKRSLKSPYRGVVPMKNRKGEIIYEAYISMNKRRHHIGYYSSPEEAARARDGAALVLHGEFAIMSAPHLDPIPYIPRPKREKTSKYTGVNYRKRDNLWAAECYIKAKTVLIGMFSSEIDAARARDAYVREHGVPVMRYNFPCKGGL